MQPPEPLDILPIEYREAVSQCLKPVRFAQGECIFRQGADGDGCYFIDAGDVRLELESNEHVDTERVLGHLSAGSLLGELALLDRLPRSATAYAESDLTARFLSRLTFEELCSQQPRVGVTIVHALGRVAALKLRQYTARLAEFLVPERADPEIDRVVALATEAQRQFEQWPEARVDALLFQLAQAVAHNAEPLARETVQQTRIGNVPDKIAKNVHASLGIYNYLQGKSGHGIIGIDTRQGITEIASAAGVIFAIIPVTNPVATAIFKALVSLKARCALILSFHRACLGVGNAVCEIMQKVLADNGAPVGLLQWVRQRGSRETTACYMSHAGVDLILATGGAGMVKAAYASGTPALGVGPGNAPVYIAADADVDNAAQAIVASKPYDNGLICGAEHNLVVDADIRDQLIVALERHGAAVLNAEETKRFSALAISANGAHFDPRVVGQSAQLIADLTGIARDYAIRLIVVPTEPGAIECGSPLAGEKLAPLLSIFTVNGDEQAFTICEAILDRAGAGHTAVIHTREPERAQRFGLRMPASRILVNTPAVQGISGITTGLIPSYTLGCGTFGRNSTTDNVSFHNLINVKRLAYFVPPASGAQT